MKHKRLALFFALLTVILAPVFASAQQSPPPTCTLSSSAGVVQKGGTVNLRWQSANAVSGTITSIGSVGPSGIQGVIPTQTTEYVGMFSGPGGTARCSVTIIVTLPGGGTSIPTGGTGGGQVQTTGAQEGGNSAFPQSPSLQTGQPVNQSDTGGLVPCIGTDCQACHLASLVQNIIKFLIMLAVPIAALLFAVAGAMYFSTEVTNKKEQAKKIIQKGIIGFIIALSAWLVVNTVFYMLFDQKQFSNWSSISCVDNRQVTGGSIQKVLDRVLGTQEPLPWSPQGTPVAACPSGYPNINEAGQCCDANYAQCVQQPACEAGYTRTAQGDCYNAQTDEYASPVVSNGNLVKIDAFNCKSSTSCAVSPTTNLQLEQMRTVLESKGLNPSQFQITETGVNTTVTHASGANNLDLSCFGACNESQVKAIVDSWGGKAVYETNNQADYSAKLNAGVPASNMLLLSGKFDSSGNCTAGKGKCITAPHVSLKP